MPSEADTSQKPAEAADQPVVINCSTDTGDEQSPPADSPQAVAAQETQRGQAVTEMVTDAEGFSTTDEAEDGPVEDSVPEPGNAEAEAGQDEQEAAEPARELTDEEKEQLALNVEAAILTTDRAISPAKLSDAMDKLGAKAIKEAVESLNAHYEETGRSFRIELVSNGYRFMTLPRFANVLSALKKTRSQTKLSPSALETLAVVAYKQPALRADVEAVRGVACGETLRALMDRGLVKIVGRSEEIGRPMLYGTTPKFLEVFGLAGLKDLPKAEDLRVNG